MRGFLAELDRHLGRRIYVARQSFEFRAYALGDGAKIEGALPLGSGKIAEDGGDRKGSYLDQLRWSTACSRRRMGLSHSCRAATAIRRVSRYSRIATAAVIPEDAGAVATQFM